jgi:late competence protein required for DNA uptake (superfamily II DNA/RNA helicase)
MNIKIIITSSLLAFIAAHPINTIAAKNSQANLNPLAIPLQAHTAKDMWESYFNQCMTYSFIDKQKLDNSLKSWQKRNANRWQIYWLLMEQAADENEGFKAHYSKFKIQSLAHAKQQTKVQHSKLDQIGKENICDKLVLMLDDTRSDLPEDSSKKTQ